MRLKLQINHLVLALLFLSSLPADAQGVIHLSPGDTYLFSQPLFVQGQIDEAGRTFINIFLGFAGDLFTPGDSLQVDILSTPTSLTPLVSSTVSNPPSTVENQIGISWPQAWNADNGAVRVTMLNGSVDISSVRAITDSHFSEIFYSYTIPEPSVPLLLAPGLVYLVLRRRRRR